MIGRHVKLVAGRQATRIVTHPLPPVVLAVAGTVAAWILLAAATSLIFHFLPGATFLAAAYAFRWRTGARRAGRREIGTILAVGGAGTAIGLGAVAGIGRELDGEALTALVVVAGAAIATIWLRRGPVRGDGGRPAIRE